MTRRRFLAALAALAPKPNLVLIISDDLGYADLPAFGKSEIPTPHLDRLAQTGVVFPQAYSTAPICVPSRMGINTGRYHQRLGVYDNMYQPEELPLFAFAGPTLAEHLKKQGYATGLVGKWHLSANRFPPIGPTPEKRGFDEWVGIEGGMSSYFPPARLYRNNQPFEAPEYLTDFFGKEAVRFIGENRRRPFFLYLGFNAPHAPLEAMDGDKTGGESSSPDRRTYAGMVRAMDRNVGRVLSALRECGLERNTLVAYVNDNGGGGNHTPAHTRNTGRNAPLRGFKFDLFEGGIRVPMMMRWPARIPGGRRFDGVVSSMDIAPTFVKAAGGELPVERPFDGVDLLPYLRGEKKDQPHPVLCWQNRAWLGPRGAQRPGGNKYHRAIRKGRWKLVQLADRKDWELFDLQSDVGEQHDLAAEYPEIVRDLEAEFERWRAQMPGPVKLP
ncbi:MAG: sulfatase-like hydrolase/transferase [Acidobacteria bacterium]|nr:sulfatase-like hydrolase/transferase [Acidobacteriota bacterium]